MLKNLFKYFWDISFVFFLFFTLQPIARAQDSIQPEDLLAMSFEELMDIKIEVSSSKAVTIFNTPSTVSVIDKDMIRKYNFLTVAEALRVISGFNIFPTYHKRDLPTSRGILQDQYANKILFMINGIPSWHSITGEANIERVDINAVERIEVLKGPASVLYGSNAYTAAVNVVLKSSTDENLDVILGIGNAKGYLSSGCYSVLKGDLSLFVNGSVFDEKGLDYHFSDMAGENGYIDTYLKTKNVTVNSRYKGHNVLFNGTSSSQAFLGGGANFPSGAGKPHSTDGYLFSYKYDRLVIKRFNITPDITYDWNSVEFTLDEEANARMLWETSRLNCTVRSDFEISDSFALDFGLDCDYRKSLDSQKFFFKQKQIITNSNLKDKSVYEYSGYMQLDYRYKRIGVLLGARLTKNEYFGTSISSRGTLVYSLDNANSLKFIYGQSFRAPSIFEIFVYSPGWLRGNPDLDPETSNSFELAYLTKVNKFFIQILSYYSTYINKIQRTARQITPEDTTHFTYTNGDEFEAKGLEIEIKYENPKLVSPFINYNFVDGNDGDIDANGYYNFKYFPQHCISAGLSRKFNDFQFSVLSNYWSKTRGVNTDISPQYSIDINLGYFHKISKAIIHHNLSVKNAADKAIVFPEYASREGGINEIPTDSGYGRRIFYTVKISWH